MAGECGSMSTLPLKPIASYEYQTYLETGYVRIWNVLQEEKDLFNQIHYFLKVL